MDRQSRFTKWDGSAKDGSTSTVCEKIGTFADINKKSSQLETFCMRHAACHRSLLTSSSVVALITNVTILVQRGNESGDSFGGSRKWGGLTLFWGVRRNSENR